MIGKSRTSSAALAVMFCLGLAACGSDDATTAPIGVTAVSHGVETAQQRRDRATAYKGTRDADPWFAGAAVADEPGAALIARQVLEQGGNAADAAAATYFGLAVTYPAAAGLGGGGVCLVHKAGKKSVETYSFLTRNPRGGGAIAIPGNVRGFALLQARNGKLPWASVVAPAERLAATGAPVSRATARQLTDAADIIRSSSDLTRSFAMPSGQIAKELDRISRLPLAATLALVRSQGVAGFYAGQTASRLVEDAAKAGGALTLEDLRDYRPDVQPAQSVAMGNGSAWLPAASLGAGAFGAALWSESATASPADLAAIARRTAVSLGASAATVDQDYGSTSFAAIDGQGGAVACAVSMNGAFGTGHVSEGTGIILVGSPATAKAGLAPAFLSPVIVTNARGTVSLVGAGSGAPSGAAAIQHVARNSASAEAGLSALEASPASAASSANAIICPQVVSASTCSLAINPRGFGMGITGVAPGS